MKILFSDNSLWSLLHFRGVIIREFIKLGHQIVLIAPYEPINERKLIAGTTLIYVKLDRTNTGIKSDIIYCKELFRIFKSEKADMIFSYTIKPSLYGCIISKILSIPSVSMLAGTGELFAGKSYKYKIARLLMRISMRFMYRLLLLNEEDRDLFFRQKYITQSKVILLNGGEGVDIDAYRPNPLYRPIKNNRRFIMVGRVLYDKGYNEYVEAAKIIRKEFSNVEFAMLGYLDKTHPLAVLEQRVIDDTRNGYINYMGTVEDIPSIVGLYDCFVLPSFYNEGMNRSLMEAISMGKAVISTDNKGCREMVINGLNGFLVKPKNVESLVFAIRKICLASEVEVLKMGQESRKLAIERFSDLQIIAEYIKIIS